MWYNLHSKYTKSNHTSFYRNLEYFLLVTDLVRNISVLLYLARQEKRIALVAIPREEEFEVFFTNRNAIIFEEILGILPRENIKSESFDRISCNLSNTCSSSILCYAVCTLGSSFSHLIAPILTSYTSFKETCLSKPVRTNVISRSTFQIRVMNQKI